MTDARTGLVWPGREDALAAADGLPELDLVFGAPPSAARHAIATGDNLDVLRRLRRSLRGRVQLAFLDPPYNTGQSFVYDDRFAEPAATYLARTAQGDAAGVYSSRFEAQGRRHASWLSMMAPRLALCRDLLAPEGFLAVTIDDHEQPRLRLLLDEIFGEDRFVATVVWQRSYSPRMDAEGFSVAHDYLLLYARSAAACVRREAVAQDPRQFPQVAADGRRYRLRSVRKEGSNSLRADAPAGWYPLTAPDGQLVWPTKPGGVEGTWRWSAATFAQRVARGEVTWRQTPQGWQPYALQFQEASPTRPPTTWWTAEDAGHNHAAADEVRALVGPRVFDTPKPTRLLRRLIRLTTDADRGHLVLDPFAGSGSTGDAVLRQNADDGGDRRYLLVQRPEPSSTHGDLAAVTRARIDAAAAALGVDDPYLDLRLGSQASPEDRVLAYLLDRGLPLEADWRRERIGRSDVWWVGDRAVVPGDVDPALWPALAGRAAEVAVADDAFSDAGARVDAAVCLAPTPLRRLP